MKSKFIEFNQFWFACSSYNLWVFFLNLSYTSFSMLSASSNFSAKGFVELISPYSLKAKAPITTAKLKIVGTIRSNLESFGSSAWAYPCSPVAFGSWSREWWYYSLLKNTSSWYHGFSLMCAYGSSLKKSGNGIWVSWIPSTHCNLLL